MAKDSIESQVSLLTKCYPYGTLPPEIDDEGNIEYKVICRIYCGYFFYEINKKIDLTYCLFETAQIGESFTGAFRTPYNTNEMEVNLIAITIL